MSGTKEGGKKASTTNKNRYGNDFYAKIGAIGGRNGTTGGFASSTERARWAGSIGGKKSKRGITHYYIITENAQGEKPDWTMTPKTAQGWRTFFSQLYPNLCPETLWHNGDHKRIIRILHETFGVKFREIF